MGFLTKTEADTKASSASNSVVNFVVGSVKKDPILDFSEVNVIAYLLKRDAVDEVSLSNNDVRLIQEKLSSLTRDYLYEINLVGKSAISISVRSAGDPTLLTDEFLELVIDQVKSAIKLKPIVAVGTDVAAQMATGEATVGANNKFKLTLTSGTVRAGADINDIAITGLPAGLTATAVKGTGNVIDITLAGTANPVLAATATLGLVVKASAVTETDFCESASLAATIVLSV